MREDARCSSASVPSSVRAIAYPWMSSVTSARSYARPGVRPSPLEHGLDEAFGFAERDRLAVADEREFSDLDLAPVSFAFASVSPTLATCASKGAAGTLETSSGCTPFTPAMRSATMTPSCIALCASHAGPPDHRSPTGRARRFRPTRSPPHASSRPSRRFGETDFSTLPTMPTARMTRSTVICSVLPSFPSTSRDVVCAFSSALTVVDVLIVSPAW